MTIDEIPTKANMSPVTDTLHQVSADELNAIVEQVKDTRDEMETLPVSTGSGEYSIAAKNKESSNRATGECATALGRNNQAVGRSSLVTGEAAVANGVCSQALGWRTETHNESEMACGRWNDSTESTKGEEQTLFSIGIGDGAKSDGTIARKNAFEAKRNGDLYMWLGGAYVRLQDVISILKYYTEGNNTATLTADTVTVEAKGSGTAATLRGYRVEIESGLDDIVLMPGSGYKARVGSKEIATVDMIEALQARVAALEKK